MQEEEEEEEEEGGSAEVSPAESAALQEGKPSEEMKFTQSVSDLNDVIFPTSHVKLTNDSSFSRLVCTLTVLVHCHHGVTGSCLTKKEETHLTDVCRKLLC